MDRPLTANRRWVVLTLMVSSLLVVVLDNSILNVALRTLADPRTGLGASQSQLEWSINAYTLVFASLLFAWSFAGDRIGRRRCLVAGLVIFGLASLASAYATDARQLIIARAAMGVGAAAVQPLSLSIVSTVFPPNERARAIGIWSAAAGLGLAIGPLLGGVLLETFWWGSIFLVNVPIVAVVLIGTLLAVPELRDARSGGLDLLGLSLSVTGLLVLTYGIIRGGELGGWTSPSAWLPLVAGAVLLTVFALAERRSANPVLDVRFFEDRRMLGGCLAVAVGFFGLMGVVFALLFYLQSVRGYSPLQAAFCATPVAVAQLLVSPRTASIVRRFGNRGAAAGGLFVTAACLAGYATLGRDTPIWVIEVMLFVHGAALSFVIPTVTELMMRAVEPSRTNAVSATNTAIRQIGTALGVAVLGAVLSMRYRTAVRSDLDGIGTGVPHDAGESIEKTFGAVAKIAERLDPVAGRALASRIGDAARDAFISGMQTATLVAAALTAVSAVLVMIWIPGRSGTGPGRAATGSSEDRAVAGLG